MSAPELEVPPAEASPTISRAYKCGHCGKPIFLRNSVCINCGAGVGYDPALRTMVSLTPVADAPGVFEREGEARGRVMTCANLTTAAGCNWLIPANPQGTFDYANQYPGFCLACSLNRTVPDQSKPQNQELWRRMEAAKRRLFSQLLALALPVETRLERPQDGIAFDFLETLPGGPRVLTGHDHGLITMNIQEADDAVREKTRADMHEPYRTLLGHFRHEIGHYYWERLVRDTALLGECRNLFGDERADYAAALQQHYSNGPPADWALHFISGYAAAHPFEDWAETWAHYLHMCDTVDTALSFAINAESVDMQAVPFEKKDLWQPQHENAEAFLSFLNTWVRLTNVLNELSRAMGQPDYYPFILPHAAVRKLQFVHEVVRGASVIAPVKNPVPVVETVGEAPAKPEETPAAPRQPAPPAAPADTTPRANAPADLTPREQAPADLKPKDQAPADATPAPVAPQN